MSQARVLYQFPLSHYCEKARWVLDFKGLSCQPRNLLPGPHRVFTRVRAAIDTLPLLHDGQRWVGDSTRIAYYLDKYYPQPALLPADAELRRTVIELEQQYDRLGVAVRRWMFGEVLGSETVAQALLGPYRLPALARRWYRPVLERGIRLLYRVTPTEQRRALERIEQGLAALEARLPEQGDGYLVGDRLTLADITAAALLAPLVAAPGTPWEGWHQDPTLPASFRNQLQAFRSRPAGQWVLRRYQQDR
ncbi:glutathione S-transferase family protein [Isoalcanivorax beigongshangi]|uniref:Glutathione S-transferase family protein n=1 Tax=Isoalcanivorax beigongshangi TaxID=3238810 RepID=A0ABV4AFR7_9GAMM